MKKGYPIICLKKASHIFMKKLETSPYLIQIKTKRYNWIILFMDSRKNGKIQNHGIMRIIGEHL